MGSRVDFELVSPEKLVIGKEVDMAVVPGSEGDFGVLRGHAPFVTTLRPGVINLHEQQKISDRLFVAGGFAEVSQERCVVLAEVAMPVEQIDVHQAKNDLAAGRESLKTARSDADRITAERQISIAEAMIAATESPYKAH